MDPPDVEYRAATAAACWRSTTSGIVRESEANVQGKQKIGG